MSYYIIVFKNTYDAMNAEKVLTNLKYNFRIMPTPTTITMSCGICVRIEEEKDIKSIENENVFEYKDIFKRENNEYIKIV